MMLLFMSLLTDFALAAQSRLDLRRGLHRRSLHRQYIGAEIRIGCSAFIF